MSLESVLKMLWVRRARVLTCGACESTEGARPNVKLLRGGACRTLGPTWFLTFDLCIDFVAGAEVALVEQLEATLR